MTNFNLSNYVDDRKQAEVRQKRRITKKHATTIIKKITSIAKEGFDIYSSIKRKDPISLALGLLSATGVVLDNLVNESLTSEEILKELAPIQVCPSTDGFVRSILKKSSLTPKYIWSDTGEHENCTIEEWDLGDSKAYYSLSGTNYSEGVFVSNEKDFFTSMSKVIKNDFGKALVLESLTGGTDWNRTLYLNPLRTDDSVYISRIDEQKMVADINHFFSMKRNRSFLFCGPPGTGKTTLAIRIAEKLGGTILVVDGRVLGDHMTGFNAINVVNPMVILLDDIDRFSEADKLLGDIERLHKESGGSGRVIIATANDLCKIPRALRRPGRFDQAIEFPYPNASQREEVFNAYVQQFEVTVTQKQVLDIIEATEGLTEAYLEEVALRLRVIDSNEMVHHIAHMKEIFNASENEESD